MQVSEEAELDLVDTHRLIAAHECTEQADNVVDQLESLGSSLAHQPLRGHVPTELDRIGVTTYRGVHLKPCRIVYEAVGREVNIHCVLDGWRNMQALLERRLIRWSGKG